MTEYAIQFWQIRDNPDGHGTGPQNRVEPPYHCPFPSNTNDSTGIPKRFFFEIFSDVKAASSISGTRAMHRPEQKLILLMGFVIRKFTKGHHMMLESFMCTEATENACLLRIKLRNYTGFDDNSECAVEKKPSLLQVIAEEVLNPTSHVTKSDKVQKVTNYNVAEEMDFAEAHK